MGKFLECFSFRNVKQIHFSSSWFFSLGAKNYSSAFIITGSKQFEHHPKFTIHIRIIRSPSTSVQSNIDQHQRLLTSDLKWSAKTTMALLTFLTWNPSKKGHICSPAEWCYRRLGDSGQRWGWRGGYVWSPHPWSQSPGWRVRISTQKLFQFCHKWSQTPRRVRTRDV